MGGVKIVRGDDKMRRTYWLVLLCVVLSFVSCNRNDNIVTYSADTKAPENEAVEPPLILNFESFEKLAELKGMLEEEEDIVAEYLDSNNYSMNGLSSKSDIAAFFDHVGDLNMFHMAPSSGYNATYIVYYPECDYDYFMSIYSNGHDRVLFRCYVDTSDGVSVSEAYAVSTLCIGEKKVALYESEDEGVYALVGRTETANSLITIMVSDDDEEIIRNTIEGNIVCMTVSELIEGEKN